jgi:trans-2,3-dihydro-3-hydroxyanthranilate isomerase
MLAPHEGVPEDPATGSAAAAFAGAVMRFDAPPDGSTRLLIEQGVEMGRPSKIRLELDVERDRLIAARIGGHAVRIAEGTLFA